MPDSPTVINSLAGKRVLICENEGITIMQLSRAVTNAGLTVAGIAADSGAAFEIARRERPDIILVDIRIPGMDAPDLIRTLKTVGDVCLITLVAQPAEAEMTLAIGASAALIKPADTAQLLLALRACIDYHSHAVVREVDKKKAMNPKP